ncbi:MAG: RNA polymerase sporulation sigma factor SigK [Tenericutes bacterium]|nr:RNA polymerase sporulation sigma factor SigK [Mycoplasmatota bacterium]
MLKKLIKMLFSNFSLFTASYSNNVFPEPLSKEEEEKYIESYLKGNQDARNKLIEHNLRLVAHIVKKYDSNKEDTDDLISIGTIGLIKGIDSFSNSKGTKITTYCARCIENEILMYFRSNNKNLKNVSLNESVGFDKDGNEITILDILKAPKPDYVDEINKKDNIKLLKDYMGVLTDREKEIIIMRYGLNNTEEQTQKKIAKELKISRSYVSRIEKRALTKILREFMKNKSVN